MIKKWFVTIEVKTVSSLKISWQQTGAEEPAWTEEIFLVEQEAQDTEETQINNVSDPNAVGNALDDVLGNGGLSETKARLTIPPLPVLPRRAMPEQSSTQQSNTEQAISEQFNTEQSSTQQAISEQSSDRLNSDFSTTSPDLDAMFGEPNVSESLQSISVPEYLSSDLENPQSFQNPEVLFLADVSPAEMAATAIDEEVDQEVDQELKQEVSDSEPEEISPAINPLRKILLETPSIPIQFAQYVVVCAVIILALRGIHAALGTTKAPKTTSAISTQIK